MSDEENTCPCGVCNVCNCYMKTLQKPVEEEVAGDYNRD